MIELNTNANSLIINQINYSSLLEQYLKSTDNKQSNSIFSFFYMSFQQLSTNYQKAIVLYIYNSLIGIIKSRNATYIFNSLNFAHQFIQDYETLIDLTCIGPQRHKVRNGYIYFNDEKMKSFINIDVKDGNNIFLFYAKPDNFISNIKLSLGVFYQTESENIYLYRNNRLITNNCLISQCDFKPKESLTAMPKNSQTYDYSESFLSLLIFNDDELFNFLLSIIKEENYFSFCTPEQFKRITKITWKLLKVIPSYHQLYKDMNDTKYATELFNRSKPELYRRYLLQIMNKVYQNDSNKTEIVKFAIESIRLKKLTDNELRDSFEIVIFYLEKENKRKYDQDLIFLVSDIIVDSKNARVSQSALNLLIEMKKDPETEKFILSKEGILLKIMRKANCDVEPFFKSFRMQTELFNILIKLVQEFSNDETMLKRLFRVLKNLIKSNCDTKETFKFVLQNVRKVKADLLIEYLEFIWHSLEAQPQLLSSTTSNNESLSIIEFLFNFISNLEESSNDFKKYERQLRKVSLKIFVILCKNDDYIKKGILKKMEVISKVPCSRWNYNPESFKRNSNGYCGLRNLGATCYMNSIFQQLYFNTDFRTNLLSYHEENKYVEAIRHIIIKLALSNQMFVDTEPFALVWSSEDQQFSVRYQEDADEFYHRLLYKLPSEVTSTFVGKVTSKIEGMNCEFNRVVEESINIIPIQVKGFQTFEKSLPTYLKPQILKDDYKVDEIGNIDVKLTLEYKSLPKTMVFLLKRFDYNVQTSKRIKITNEFHFPLNFNADEYFPGQNGQYYLKGVITHTGTAEGGHFNSLIRQGNIWIIFDDMESRNITADEFNDFVVGNEKVENSKCAYLLFYENRNIENDPNENPDIRPLIKPEEVNKITEENNNFSIMQASFDESTAEFALNSNDLPFTIHYFINVLCHSCMTSLSSSFADKILKYINEKSSNAQMITSYLKDSKELIFEITKGAPSEFKDSILRVLSNLFEKVDYLSPFPIVDHIVQNLKDSFSVWKTLPYLAQIIHSYIKLDKDHVKMGSSNSWGIKILNYIQAFYDDSSLGIFPLSNIDFSYMFKSLEIFYPEMDSNLMKSFVLKYGEMIEKSNGNLEAFRDLKDMINGIKQAQEAASNQEGFCKYLICLDTSESINQSIEKCRKPKIWILNAFYKYSSIVRETLLKYKKEVLFPLLIDESCNNRDKAERLIYKLFDKIPKLENYQKAELLYNGKSYVNVFDRDTAERSNKRHIIKEIKELKIQNSKKNSIKLIKEIKKKYRMKDSILYYINKEADDFLDSFLEYIRVNSSNITNRMSHSFRIIHWIKVRTGNTNILNLRELLNVIGVQMNSKDRPNIDLIELLHLYQTFTDEQFDSFFKEYFNILIYSLCPDSGLPDHVARFVMFISLISTAEQFIMCFKSGYFFPAYSFLFECPLPQPFCYMAAKLCSLLSHEREKKKIRRTKNDEINKENESTNEKKNNNNNDDEEEDDKIDHTNLSNPVEVDPQTFIGDEEEDEEENAENRNVFKPKEEEEMNEDDNRITKFIKKQLNKELESQSNSNNGLMKNELDGHQRIRMRINNKSMTKEEDLDEEEEMGNDEENGEFDGQLNTEYDLSLILSFAEFIGAHANFSFFTPQTSNGEAVFIYILYKIRSYFTPELTSLYINQYFTFYEHFKNHENLIDYTSLILSLPNTDKYQVDQQTANMIVSNNFKRIFLDIKEFHPLLIQIASASFEFANSFLSEFELFVTKKGQYKNENNNKNPIQNSHVLPLTEVYMNCLQNEKINGEIKGEKMMFIVSHFFNSSENLDWCVNFASSDLGHACIKIISSIVKRNNNHEANQDNIFDATIELFGFLTVNKIPISPEIEEFLIAYLDNLEIYDLDVESLADSINSGNDPNFEYSVKLLSVFFKAKAGMKEYFLQNFPIRQEVLNSWPNSLSEYRNLFII